jgi:phosphatidate cytidylyltransferase
MVAVFVGAPLYPLGIAIIGIISAAELGDMIRRGKTRVPLSAVLLLLGLAYIGAALLASVAIRNGSSGLQWTLLLLLTSWGTDSFALMGGRLYGKRPLAPRISPKKTVEGAMIGLSSGAIVGLLYGALSQLPIGMVLLASIVIPPATEAGDLLESWVKRQLGVKDSGSLLPGHGGFLDRIDGLLLSTPCLFIVLKLFGI